MHLPHHPFKKAQIIFLNLNILIFINFIFFCEYFFLAFQPLLLFVILGGGKEWQTIWDI